MLKWTLFLLVFLSLFSCGNNTDEKIAEAILNAQICLGTSDCQCAIDGLEGVGRQNTNAHYLKTLSSAYACRAGYSTPQFFANDLPKTATPAPLGGTTIYSTSGVAVTNPLQDDPEFVDLQTAISILLYAGGLSATTEPTAAERAKHFSADDAGDINSQLMFMEFVQLGKYMHVYGNGNAAGAKGAGTAPNKCFTSYAHIYPGPPGAGVAGVLAALPGACHVANSSHAQLDEAIAPITTRKTRLCHGVVLLNGIFDILPSVLGAATGGSLGAISGATAAITAARTALTTAYPTIGAVMTTVSQTNCEDTAVVPLMDVESYFAVMMENVFQ